METDNKEDSQLKVNDFIMVQRDDDEAYDPGEWHGVFIVFDVQDEVVEYGWADDSSYRFRTSISRCVKIPDEQINRYFELKKMERPTYDPESFSKIKPGNIVRRVSGRTHRNQDLLVLGRTSDKLFCTTLNTSKYVRTFDVKECKLVREKEEKE